MVINPTSHYAAGAAGLLMLAAGVLAASPAQAQDTPEPQAGHRLRLVRAASAQPLTVHRRTPHFVQTPIVAEDGLYDETGTFRTWDDPRLYTFYGWRLGGDNFYGDQAGDPITRGNASLGMIAGYGPANGGYGGPHFDSVGGFHNGPGPEAKEAADYASGTISTPDLTGPPPHYPSIKQQVAQLNTGIAGTGQVSRVASHPSWTHADRASDVAPHEDLPQPREHDDFDGF